MAKEKDQEIPLTVEDYLVERKASIESHLQRAFTVYCKIKMPGATKVRAEWTAELENFKNSPPPQI